MNFTNSSVLLDAVVLASVAQEKDGTYGYKITQDVRAALDVSESTLYPVLRRLQTGGLLETYDMEFNGRNRRYYRITESGREELEKIKAGWKDHVRKVNAILLNEKEEGNDSE